MVLVYNSSKFKGEVIMATEKQIQTFIEQYKQTLLWSSGGDKDYSEPPEGYEVGYQEGMLDRPGTPWVVYECGVDQGAYRTEREAIIAAWEHSGEEPMDLDGLEDYDMSESANKECEEDCRNFLEVYGHLVEEAGEYGYDYSQAGHDFALTRNRHGAGFWDRGLGVVGDKLTEASHSFGDAYCFIGDDGLVYIG